MSHVLPLFIVTCISFVVITRPTMPKFYLALADYCSAIRVKTSGGYTPGHKKGLTLMMGTARTETDLLHTDEETADVTPAAVDVDTYVRQLESQVAHYRNGLMAAHAAARGLAESLRTTGNPVSDEWHRRQAALLAEATYVWANTEEPAA